MTIPVGTTTMWLVTRNSQPHLVFPSEAAAREWARAQRGAYWTVSAIPAAAGVMLAGVSGGAEQLPDGWQPPARLPELQRRHANVSGRCAGAGWYPEARPNGVAPRIRCSTCSGILD
ncbi:hypothetical protein [Pseudonocardia sp. HH130630-07]|uniref:hypothetical protein n=1 Tax=Pseudonocardia sp. HH130630-07 TaxID=1690815 RepID=UPI0012E9DF29|nr:hypothetical protein [Pseudonocardia sp. HH130630-07]